MKKVNKQSIFQRIILGKQERSINLRDFDLSVLLISFSLVLFGLVMISSITLPMTDGSLLMTINHLQKILIALFIALFIFRFPISFWEEYSIYFVMVSLFLLLLVFLPIIGNEVKGANRWIKIFGFTFQPSEFLKFSLIIYISSYCIRRFEEVKEHWIGFWKPMLVLAISISLVILEPDLGSSVVMFLISLSIMFIAGAPLKHFFSIFILGITIFAALIYSAEYRFRRILGYIDPWNYDGSDQLKYSLSAINNGDLLGVGLGESIHKFFYLADAQTDFIFAIITEELGIIFSLFLIIVFSYLVFRCFAIGRVARKKEFLFGSYISYGIGVCIALHVFINIGVATGLLPTKGITLPFISFGGSNLILMFSLVSLLLKINLEINFTNTVQKKVMNV